MTRTEERLVDALDAAARAMPEDEMRPLIVPVQRPRRLAWAAPVASAAGLLLVVGLAVAVAGHLPGSGQITSGPPAPHPYYVVADSNGDLPQVLSTATGSVTATLQVPHVPKPQEPALVAAANGVFFAAVAQQAGERLYRFRLTSTGQITGTTELPLAGGVLATSDWEVHAMAASPDGRWLALTLTYADLNGVASCSSSTNAGCVPLQPSPDALFNPGLSDNIAIVNTATGQKSAWDGARPTIGSSTAYSVPSLSWSANSQSLNFIVRQCPLQGANIVRAACTSAATGDSGWSASIWQINRPSRPGHLTARLVHSLDLSYSDVPAALLSPDGSTITAVLPPQVVVEQVAPLSGAPSVAGTVPPYVFTVAQISVATGKALRGLLVQNLGRVSPTDVLYATLSTDATGQHWLLGGGYCDGRHCAGGFNGWIDHGKLVPLPPGDGSVADEAW
jgi:hypothetical protein